MSHTIGNKTSCQTQQADVSLAAQLLDPSLTRRQLKAVSIPVCSKTIILRVNRTLPFEFIEGVLNPFLCLWDSQQTISYSDYDPSLPHLLIDVKCDIHLLWMDWRLYWDSMTPSQAVHWLIGRIRELRSLTDKPVLVNNWPIGGQVGESFFYTSRCKRQWVTSFNATLMDSISHITGCEIIDLSFLASQIGSTFFDNRNDEISHYPFSEIATIAIAKHLGLQLFPALLMPRLKAIALDMDDTLYAGVLGEDGVDGVQLTEGHRQLHLTLRSLKESGIFLAICSRNEEADVLALFDKRADFPLNWQDFAAVMINWQPKAQNIVSLSNVLNISSSAFLFLDDNPAELLKVANILTETKTLLADKDGYLTSHRLSYYPGLFQLFKDESAQLRTVDVQANQIRQSMLEQASSKTDYLRSLNMIVRLYENCKSHTSRLFELSQKTNQFNLALSRMSQIDAERVMGDGYLTLTVGLSDALSDSGLIGAFVCHLHTTHAELVESLMSCRALGRDVETITFLHLLERLRERGIQTLDINVRKGPRNQPALEWLSRWLDREPKAIPVDELYNNVYVHCKDYPITVENISHE